MTNAGNMYVDGQPGEREWGNKQRQEKEAMAHAVLPNQNNLLPIGHIVNLPIRHRDFNADLSAKNLHPVDFSQLSNATESELREAVAWVQEKVGWFHSVDLPHGIATPGSRGWEERAHRFAVAERVKGKTVLDIGAVEGGDTFAAEAAGAQLTAYDVDNYLEYDLGLNAAWDHIVDRFFSARAAGPEAEWIFLNAKRLGFELCRAARRSAAVRLSGSVYDLNPARHGQFDVVYCFGLLYHLRNPVLAIDRISAVTREMAFFNNQILAGYAPNPNTVLFFNETWRGSYTNWFVPTPQSFLGMLGSAGFRQLEVVDQSPTALSVIAHK
jgi:tRNA (mo5U34)-methyltransferase